MVYIFLADGFEEIEALTPADLLRRAGVEVALAGVTGDVVTGAHGIKVVCDMAAADAADVICSPAGAEMIVLPGGLGGVASIRASQPAMDAIRWAYENDKYTAAICAGPTILADLSITDGKKAVCYPGCEENMGNATMINAPCVQDGKVITGASAGCATAFGLALIRALKGDAVANTVAQQIVMRTQEV